MEFNARYRLIALLCAIGVLAGLFLVFHLGTLVGRSQLAWEDLPEPVRQAVREQAGEAAVVVQVVKARTPRAATYRITLHRANGEHQDLWLTAAGSPWRPAPSPPAE
ncbi:MAG: hypothetical protein ACRD2Z_16785 [Thermoanaerobaculia bacterium]